MTNVTTVRNSETARAAAADKKPKPRRLGANLLRAFATKLFVLLVIFVTVPIIVYDQLRAADEDKKLLLMESAHQQGRMVAEIREMQADMEKVRKSVGVYPMLFVRGLFTEEMLSVWDRMQTKVQERSVATGGQKGGGLWSSLEERVQSPLKNGRVD